MKKFILTCGAEILLDDEDYERIPKKGWYLTGYKRSDCSHDRKTVYAIHDTYGRMHRWILGLTDNKILVDHIDKNGLNNQKSNLRLVSSSLNKKNQSTTVANKFNFNGIRYEDNGKYQRIRVSWTEGKPIWIEGFGWRAKERTRTFSLKKYNYDLNQILREAILFRIKKMKENGYLIDERSTTIEKILLEKEYVNMEQLLNISFQECFSRVALNNAK